MIEVSIFTVVVAHPQAPSVVVLAEKSNSLGAELGVAPRAASGEEPEAALEAAPSAALSAAPESTDSTEPSVEFSFANDVEADMEAGLEGEEPQLLPIWIGHSEAEAIMLLLEKQPHTRPLTHDLLANVIGALGSKVERIVIDRVKGSTFYASIRLTRDGRTITIDARPSDSIALALRTRARIYVDEDVMNTAARQFRVKVSDGGELLYGSEDEMARFHSFIESVSPEDFV